ncbi:phenoloxidase-activating factor 2-like isoform X2 [Cylas formicarius]|uniref:phenoloxidase-activating factor 2-like isoform X2 n=1 Tax=Cylas formicarius TaxID=197179 RepID=UPI0029583557|nr:phenoloxidase-activating factor 2-like isoform X2 [Cylas formicarius]
MQMDMILSIIFVILLRILVFVTTMSGVTPNGEVFLCLPEDTVCPTIGHLGSDIIDPRIVTPTGLCPSGFYPCFGIDPKCGQRLIADISTEDGVSDPGGYPWQAYLRNVTHIFSGSGALLDSFHVLTAAHKIASIEDQPEDLTVYFGVWNPSNLKDTQSSIVADIRIHPSFNSKTLLNDIAILRLRQPIVFGIHNTINTICLPEYETDFIGSLCSVAGWGQSSFNSLDAPTSPQKQVTVKVADAKTCRDSFAKPNLLGTNVDVYLDQVGEICAGGEAMRDACTDGGSPLVCPGSDGKLNAAGLVIWGKNCGQPGVYGVYVNLPYYSNWIQTTIESLNVLDNVVTSNYKRLTLI